MPYCRNPSQTDCKALLVVSQNLFLLRLSQKVRRNVSEPGPFRPDSSEGPEQERGLNIETVFLQRLHELEEVSIYPSRIAGCDHTQINICLLNTGTS